MANDIITVNEAGAVVAHDHSRDDPQLGLSRDAFRRSLVDYYERQTLSDLDAGHSPHMPRQIEYRPYQP